MANVDNPNGFKYVGAISGKRVGLITCTLATNQTINKGDFLIMNNNLVQIALSNSGALHAVAAESKTTTSATADILCYPADTDILFEGQCSGAYAHASHLYVACDIEGTTGIMEVDEDANTESVIQIMEWVDNGKNEVGANARVKIRVIRSTYTPFLAAL